jgi:branched-chain amino acid transport system permease protein
VQSTALGLPKGLPTWREGIFAAVVVLGYVLFPSSRLLGSQILIGGVFALSLDLVLGYAGIVSLGHAAFFGLGAYAAGLLASHGWREPLSGLCLASLGSGLLGFAVSRLVVRAQHLGRLMVTLGLGVLLHEGANQARSLTGGSDGLWGVQMDKLLGIWEFDLAGHTAYAYAAAVAGLSLVGLRRLVESPFGLSLRGIREGARRMPALGANVPARLSVAFGLASALAGAAGALLAQTTQFVSLEVLSFERSANVLVMLVLGGVGRLYGGFVGTLAFTLLQETLSAQDPVFWRFWVGLVVVVLALLGNAGLLGLLGKVGNRLACRRAGRGLRQVPLARGGDALPPSTGAGGQA